jgi:hypothetical protein
MITSRSDPNQEFDYQRGCDTCMKQKSDTLYNQECGRRQDCDPQQECETIHNFDPKQKSDLNQECDPNQE